MQTINVKGCIWVTSPPKYIYWNIYTPAVNMIALREINFHLFKKTGNMGGGRRHDTPE